MTRHTTRTPYETDQPDRIRDGRELQFLRRQPRLWANALARCGYLEAERAAGAVATDAEIDAYDAWVREREVEWDRRFDAERERRRSVLMQKEVA